MPPASSNTFYVTPNPEDFYCYLDSAYPFAIHFAILRSIYLNGLSIKKQAASCELPVLVYNTLLFFKREFLLNTLRTPIKKNYSITIFQL